ncbi:copper fist DNA binding domain-containing protein [Flagelloscypha sp. PMI_526]|nr:copper fist DNA binding domain-containing protein [Flagelloscypha sp. PMI_526]
MLSANGRKLACEKCIKGHRSSSCRHTDRELLEIKPKGRPQTQCDHCRELRKVKQIHVKCECLKSTKTTGDESSQAKSCCGRLPELCECTTPRKRPTRTRIHAPDSPIMNRISELRETAPSSRNMPPYPAFSDVGFFQLMAPLEQGSGFPAPCNCGSGCRCPGCPEHHPLSARGHKDPYGSCADPSGCLACLDQAILALPASETGNWQGHDQWQFNSDENLAAHTTPEAAVYGSPGELSGQSSFEYNSRASTSSSSADPSFFSPYGVGNW